MAQDDLRQALKMMTADPAVAERIAAGDHSDLAALSLTDDELQVIADAAADLPDVAGFALGSLTSLPPTGMVGPMKFNLAQKGDKWNVAIKGDWT